MRKVTIPVVLFLFLGVAAIGTGSIGAEKTPPPPVNVLDLVVPVDGEWAGYTYTDLTAMWWQYALGQKDGSVPGLTPDAYQFARQLRGVDVWFLAGSFAPGEETRSIEIPADKAIFLPIINQGYIADPKENPAKGWEKVTHAVDMADVSTLECIIDGVPVPNLADYRANAGGEGKTWPFEVECYGAFGLNGTYVAVTDGYWILLKPLPRGEHTLQFAGVGAKGFAVDITYNITVE